VPGKAGFEHDDEGTVIALDAPTQSLEIRVIQTGWPVELSDRLPAVPHARKAFPDALQSYKAMVINLGHDSDTADVR
jgi:hypothetical protein